MYVGRGPDFIMLGPMKTGSSTVWNNIKEHPLLFEGDGWGRGFQRPLEKEYHYYDGFYGHRTLNAYKEIWSTNFNPKIKNFECTPAYFYCPLQMSRLLSDFPSIKMMICLRDPVDRFLSHYKHFRMVFEMSTNPNSIEDVKNRNGEDFYNEHKNEIDFIANQRVGLEPNKLNEIIEMYKNQGWYTKNRDEHIRYIDHPKHRGKYLFNGTGNYFYQGEYITHIKNILSIIGKPNFDRNVLINKFSDLSGSSEDKKKYYNSIFNFLEIEEVEINENLKVQSHDFNSKLYDASSEIEDEHIEYIQEYYKPFNKMLNEFMKEEIF